MEWSKNVCDELPKKHLSDLYCLRIVVLEELRKPAGLSELVRSLGTRNVREAMSPSLSDSAVIRLIFGLDTEH